MKAIFATKLNTAIHHGSTINRPDAYRHPLESPTIPTANPMANHRGCTAGKNHRRTAHPASTGAAKTSNTRSVHTTAITINSTCMTPLP